MERNTLIKAIAIGGIFAAVYATVTALSVYVLPILGVFSLLILPFFSAYYSSVYDYKMMLIFDIAVTVVCFLIGIADPLFSILYIVPSLIVGNTYGVFTKMKLKYFLTLFLQTFSYSITNIMSLIIAEKLFDMNIVSFIIADEWVFNNLSFCILFILSGAEAFVSMTFIETQLKKVKINREKERTIPLYLYILYIALTLADIGIYFLNKNLFYLIVLILYIGAIPLLVEATKLIKYKYAFLMIYAVVAFSLNFYLCSIGLFYWVPYIIVTPVTLYCLVKIVIYIYNITNSKGGK